MYLQAAHSLHITNREHDGQQGIEALVDNPHTVHKLGDPLTVAAIVVLEGYGADSTGDGIQHHEGNHNGQLLIILEDHGRWENDAAHQLASAGCHPYKGRLVT